MSALHDLSVPILMAFAVLAGPIATLSQAGPADPDGPILVVGRDPEGAVARAGGRTIGSDAAPWAVLAQGDAGVIARLKDDGAWAVLDAGWVAALCGQ